MPLMTLFQAPGAKLSSTHYSVGLLMHKLDYLERCRPGGLLASVRSGCRQEAGLFPGAPTWPVTPSLDQAPCRERIPILPPLPPPPRRALLPWWAPVARAGRGGRRSLGSGVAQAGPEAPRLGRGLAGRERRALTRGRRESGGRIPRGPPRPSWGSRGTPRCKARAQGRCRGARRRAPGGGPGRAGRREAAGERGARPRGGRAS